MIQVWFFTGLVLTLLLKPGGLGSALWKASLDGVPRRRALVGYFLGDNAGAWTTLITLVVGWLVLGLYLGEVAELADWAASGWLSALPHHPSVAALLGVVVEGAAPTVIRWFVGKMGGGQ